MNKEKVSTEPLLKPEKVAEMLGIRRKTVVLWAREERLPAVRVGRFYRFRPAEIQDWISQNSSR